MNANTNRPLTFTSEQAAEDWLRSVGRPGCGMLWYRQGSAETWIALDNTVLDGAFRAFTAPDRVIVLE